MSINGSGMEYAERNPFFVLLLAALFSFLLLPVLSTSATGNKNSENVRSKRDSNPDALLSPEDSLKEFVNPRKGNELTSTDELGFGQSIRKQSAGEIREEEAKQKRLRDFIGKRDYIESTDSVDPSSQSGGESVSEDEGSAVKRWPSFAAFQGDKRTDNSVTKRSVDKRLRDFVGKRANYDKRLRDFVGKRDGDDGLVYDKRLRDFVGKRGYLPYPFELQKRLRDFVGKRSSSGLYPFELQKRLRDFVGKREDMGYPYELQKRLRDFVGKRDSSLYSLETQKRLRDFVGKRDDMENPSKLQKRLRDFVGKREYIPYPFELEKRLRDFVGKRQALTQPSDIQKRLRDFVGKREFESYPFAVDKRLRDFVGKRENNPLDLQKRLRDFVGKRDTMPFSDGIQKRLRDFVGKRDTMPFSDGIQKRLRDFVGKREASLSEVEKRLRDFVGKRSQENNFPVEGAIELSRYSDWNYDSDSTKNNGPDEPPLLMDTQQQEEAFFDENPSMGVIKRAPIREFVGKRTGRDMVNNVGIPFVVEGDVDASLNGDEEDDPVSDEDMMMAVSKRLRDFVGKRTGVDKRLRDFVGKRNGMDGLL